MLVFSLDNESGKPLYQQIYEYIKEEIMQGRLSYREKLPSARELAASLLVSRNPVDTAYEQLVAEGYELVTVSELLGLPEIECSAEKYVYHRRDTEQNIRPDAVPQN